MDPARGCDLKVFDFAGQGMGHRGALGGDPRSSRQYPSQVGDHCNVPFLSCYRRQRAFIAA